MATANEFVKKALTYEGSTDGDYFIREYNKITGRGIPLGSHWCAMFVSVVARQCGVDTSEIPNYEGCITGERLFRSLNRWRDASGYTPKAGDIIIFDWDKENNNGNDHTGVVIETKGGRVYTIEGNSGGKCQRRDYGLTSSVIVGYGTPIYKEEKMTYEDFIAYTERYSKQNKQEYAALENVPSYYRDAVRYYVDNGIVKGKSYDGKVILGLSETECRMLTWLYRAEAADILEGNYE